MRNELRARTRNSVGTKISTPLAFFATLALEASSQAAPTAPPRWLEVNRSEEAKSCPNASTLAEQLTPLLSGPGPERKVRIDFTRDTEGYSAVITKVGHPGSRRLSDSDTDCTVLSRATATVVALLLESDKENEAPPAAPQAQPSQPTSERDELSVAKEPSKPGHLSVGAHLEVGASIGYLPEPNPVLSASAAFALGPLENEWGLSFLLPHQLVVNPGTLRTSALGAHTNLSWRIVDGQRVRLILSTGLVYGSLKVSAQGFTENGAESRPWLWLPTGAKVSGAIVETQHGELRWRLGASLVFAPMRESFHIEGLGTAFTTGAASGLLVGGVELSWLK